MVTISQFRRVAKQIYPPILKGKKQAFRITLMERTPNGRYRYVSFSGVGTTKDVRRMIKARQRLSVSDMYEIMKTDTDMRSTPLYGDIEKKRRLRR